MAREKGFEQVRGVERFEPGLALAIRGARDFVGLEAPGGAVQTIDDHFVSVVCCCAVVSLSHNPNHYHTS